MIPPLDLDTLLWTDLVEIAQEQISDLSSEWTLHAPVDPGITIIEAFAERLEERLFRLDGIDAAAVDASLALLGLPGRASTQVGRVLMTLNPDTALSTPLEAGEQFYAANSWSRAVLTNPEPVDLLGRGRIVRVVADASDLSTQLFDEWDIADLPDTLRSRDGASIFRTVGAGSVAITISYLGRPPATIAFVVGLHDHGRPSSFGWAAGGSWIRVCEGELLEPIGDLFDVVWAVNGEVVGAADGTGGLRHSGIVRLSVPPQLRASKPQNPDDERTLTIELRSTRHAHVDPPILRSLSINAFIAEHRRTITVSSTDNQQTSEEPIQMPVASRWNGLPGFTIDLEDLVGNHGVVNDDKNQLLDNGSAWLALRERDIETHRWSSVPSFDTCGPGDRVFVVDRAQSKLRFGDGISGRVPRPYTRPDGTVDATTHIELGGGPFGAGQIGSTWVARPASTAPFETILARRLVQGAESESAEDAVARVRIARTRRRVALTPSDLEEVIMEADPLLSDARVHVIFGADPSTPGVMIPDAVSVMCIPWASRPSERAEAFLETYEVPTPVLDGGLRSAVERALSRSRLLGRAVHLVDPTYRPVQIHVRLSDALRQNEQAQLAGALRRFLDPRVGLNGDGWEPGRAVSVSGLLIQAQLALANSSVVELTTTLPGFAPQCESRSSNCDPLEIDQLELPFLRALEIES